MIETVRAFVETHQAVLSLVILAAMFVGFLMERLPATVIAILGACTYLALGILDADAMYSVFSNTAPIVIGAMFVRYWFAARRLGFTIGRDGSIEPLAGPSGTSLKRVAREALAP